MEFIIQHLLDMGGLVGASFAAFLSWIMWKDTVRNKTPDPIEDKGEDSISDLNGDISDSEAKIAKIITTHLKEIKYSQQNSAQTLAQIESSLNKMADTFQAINDDNSKKNIKLTAELKRVNDSRVDDIRQLITDTTKSIENTNRVLENIQFVLKNSK